MDPTFSGCLSWTWASTFDDELVVALAANGLPARTVDLLGHVSSLFGLAGV